MRAASAGAAAISVSFAMPAATASSSFSSTPPRPSSPSSSSPSSAAPKPSSRGAAAPASAARSFADASGGSRCRARPHARSARSAGLAPRAWSAATSATAAARPSCRTPCIAYVRSAAAPLQGRRNSFSAATRSPSAASRSGSLWPSRPSPHAQSARFETRVSAPDDRWRRSSAATAAAVPGRRSLRRAMPCSSCAASVRLPPWCSLRWLPRASSDSSDRAAARPGPPSSLPPASLRQRPSAHTTFAIWRACRRGAWSDAMDASCSSIAAGFSAADPARPPPRAAAGPSSRGITASAADTWSASNLSP
ncbi:MAG: hypothetical protein J3K34DRAFT_398664 [Monoraphidium minutum]|nr:MAG: hypothetical protein J3K34DRAFT_398664 [Monoraphidium minutum]